MTFALLRGCTTAVVEGQVLSLMLENYYISAVAASLLYYLCQLLCYDMYV